MPRAPGPLHILDRRARGALVAVLGRLPPLDGGPIEVSFQPDLHAHRGKLLSGAGKGIVVHAGSHMRQRSMVLDSWLKCHPAELERIFIHEIHHFVWMRLGNGKRRSYEDLIRWQADEAGELGWSAEGMKNSLRAGDPGGRTRRWREYVCESFCDTAAWFYSRRTSHPEWTLGAGSRAERKVWFEEYFGGRPLFL